MLAWLKAMEDRPKARFEARMEALEAVVRQCNEFKRQAYDKITKRLDDFEAVCRQATTMYEAVRQHPNLRNVDEKVVRHTVIEWFHGSRDHYSGVRGKRKDVVQGDFLDLLNSDDT
ncbi:unnamed protein product, partial [Dibothriocephalus latus]